MKYIIGPSQIHGMGVIANLDLVPGDSVGVATHQFVVTKSLGKYINHSYTPNSELMNIDGDYLLITTKPIQKGDEITTNYNEAPWFIKRAGPDFI